MDWIPFIATGLIAAFWAFVAQWQKKIKRDIKTLQEARVKTDAEGGSTK